MKVTKLSHDVQNPTQGTIENSQGRTPTSFISANGSDASRHNFLKGGSLLSWIDVV
jgi:hypothetical protein